MNKAVDIASCICKRFHKVYDEPIDEMELHQLLYFAQRESLAITGEPLFSDAFEGWRYGPICVSVRYHFSLGEMNSGDAGIESDADRGGTEELKLSDIRKDPEKVHPCDSAWDMYLDEFEDHEDSKYPFPAKSHTCVHINRPS